MKQFDAQPVITRCVACEREVTRQRDILQFKRVYLKDCDYHRDLWDAANEREEERAAKRRRAFIPSDFPNLRPPTDDGDEVPF